MNSDLVYSYDIFDTCLVRACGKAFLVFDILAKDVLGPDASHTSVRDFSLVRRLGEEEARKTLIKDGKEDVTIQEIYEFCDFSPLTKLPKSVIIEKELETEKRILVPVYQICEEIRELHQSGKHVIFISDMYLPCSFVKSILQDNGLFVEGDSIYISGERGKSKRTGNLFRLISKEKDIRFNKWRHKGDNKQSDYIVPRKMGIKCEMVRNGYTFYEKELICRDFNNRAFENSIAASISRAIRLNQKSDSYTLFATDFIAPIYVSFVHRLLDDAVKKGLNKLFFLARDGYLFYLIAKEFTKLYPQISLHYLCVSRKSLYLPGLKDVSYNSLTNIIPNLNRKGISDLLDILQMPNSYSEHVKGNDVYEQLTDLYNDEEFVRELNDKHTEQRNNCLNYFVQEGITEGNNAIVDLVGTRKCQISINEILSSNGFPRVFGYYFDIMAIRQVGLDYTSFSFQENVSINSCNFYRGSQAIFEQHFSISDQDRTISYAEEYGKYVPVYEEETGDKEYRRMISEIHAKVCVEFTRYYLCHKLNNPELISTNVLSLYGNFCLVPRKKYLEALKCTKVTNSKLQSEPLLYRQGNVKTILNRKGWWYGVFIFNSSWLYPFYLFILQLLFCLRRRSILNKI